MPFYSERVAAELQEFTEEIRHFGRDDEEAVDEYRAAFEDALDEYEWEPLREELGPERYPGGLPTPEWDDYEQPVVPFTPSASWDNHEAVNEFAKDVLEGVTTVAADGSNLGPTEEFTVPLGLVQVAWCANHHHQDGDYDEGVNTRLLGPHEVTQESDEEDGVLYPDGRAPGHERYNDEGETIVECIERYADCEPPAVVFYDGPLVPSFANTYDPEIRDGYYRETMSRVLAASEHHRVPVVGYTAGSGRTNVTKLLRRTYRDRLVDHPFVADTRLFEAFTTNWGDRSLLFVNRQDGATDAMSATYRGEEYEFAEDVLFGYVDVPGDGTMDHVELPGWIHRDGLVEYVFDVIRAEASVGRGYPELLQQADANAVLDAEAKRQFLALVQEFADEQDLPIEWDAKALSKERRRRR
jgi:hypothetical protein